MKKNKWYNASKVSPDKYDNLIVMTDMGYIFQAEYLNGEWHIYIENGIIHKMYLDRCENQESIVKWMKV